MKKYTKPSKIVSWFAAGLLGLAALLYSESDKIAEYLTKFNKISSPATVTHTSKRSIKDYFEQYVKREVNRYEKEIRDRYKDDTMIIIEVERIISEELIGYDEILRKLGLPEELVAAFNPDSCDVLPEEIQVPESAIEKIPKELKEYVH